MRSRQSGFTLVEIAIVLVIIGLLLGGVLKGQELINSAKVKPDCLLLMIISPAGWLFDKLLQAFIVPQLETLPIQLINA